MTQVTSDSTRTVNCIGTVVWRNSRGKRHRTDGPAEEYHNGAKAWYLNDRLHRAGGPAIEYRGGSKEWWVNGKPHRTDGPAFEYVEGNREWYLNGEFPKKDIPGMTIVHRHTHRGYILVYEFASKKYYAGCRHFTAEEALAHWGRSNHRAPKIAAGYVEAIEKHQKTLRGKDNGLV